MGGGTGVEMATEYTRAPLTMPCGIYRRVIAMRGRLWGPSAGGGQTGSSGDVVSSHQRILQTKGS